MDALQPTSSGAPQGDTTNLLFRAGLVCLSFAAAQAWFMLLSFHLQCVLTLFAFGIAAFIVCIKQTLQRRGLFSFFPPRVQQYLSERTFLHLMRSTITKNIPIGDLVALIALPLQQHEFEPILNRLPEGYRKFLLRPLKSFISSSSSTLSETSSNNPIPLELSHEVRIDSQSASTSVRSLVLSSITQDSSISSESLFTPTAASASTQLRIPPTPVSPALMSPHANSTSLVLAPPPSADLSAYQSIFAFLAQPSPHLSFGAATKEFVLQRLHSQLTALFRVADLQREGRLEYLTLGAIVALVLHMRVSSDSRRWARTAAAALACGGQIAIWTSLALCWWYRKQNYPSNQLLLLPPGGFSRSIEQLTPPLQRAANDAVLYVSDATLRFRRLLLSMSERISTHASKPHVVAMGAAAPATLLVLWWLLRRRTHA